MEFRTAEMAKVEWSAHHTGIVRLRSRSIHPTLHSPVLALVLGFHASLLSSPTQRFPSSSTLGWYTFVTNLTLGPLKGYSMGKSMLTSKRPPAYGVDGGPSRSAVQW